MLVDNSSQKLKKTVPYQKVQLNRFVSVLSELNEILSVTKIN